MATRQSITCICYYSTINLIYTVLIQVYLMTCCFLFRRLSRCNINNNCDISRRCCDIYRQRFFATFLVNKATYTGSGVYPFISLLLRRFQQIATFPGDGATFSVGFDVSRRCDISRRRCDIFRRF